MPVHAHMADQLADPAARQRAAGRARAVLAGLSGRARRQRLVGRGQMDRGHASRSAAERFDAACDRWRQLYRAALADQREQNRRVLDNAIDAGHRRQAQARRRTRRTSSGCCRNEDTEAAVQRLLLLPLLRLGRASCPATPSRGCRWPLTSPASGSRGAYIQRPRFIAVGEFGPGALIYHEGQRYQVTRIQVRPAVAPSRATWRRPRCGICGVLRLLARPAGGVDRCEECGALAWRRAGRADAAADRAHGAAPPDLLRRGGASPRWFRAEDLLPVQLAQARRSGTTACHGDSVTAGIAESRNWSTATPPRCGW